ncbi:MAG: potassium channel family protein [Planctomycetota bacterium]
MLAPRIENIRVPEPRRSRWRSGSKLWREWCFVRVLFRHFRLRFLLVTAILMGGALAFVAFEPERRHSVLSGLFHTWALVFGEEPDQLPRSTVLRVAVFLLPVLGLTIIIEGIIDLALVVRDRRRYERSWCTMLAKSYSDHVVLVGFGRLGYHTFRLLRRMGEAVVVIERDDHNEFLEDARREGSPLLIGDARREALLVDANVAKARSIILATDDDMANLEIALDARRLNAKIRVVLRMFDPNVAEKVGQGFDIHHAMSESGISAPSFALASLIPSLVGSYVVDDELIVLQRWLVRQGGPICDLTVQGVYERFGLTVVEHRSSDGSTKLFPPLPTPLRAGDGLIVQGPFETVARIGEEILRLD